VRTGNGHRRGHFGVLLELETQCPAREGTSYPIRYTIQPKRYRYNCTQW
jgi:hypothetical protein